jgi:rhodanese-related sulfurtransferase
MAIQMGATVYDLEQAELCYAPQFGAAKDPVNLAGMIAANVQRGDHPIVHWRQPRPDDVFLLDVREPVEFARGHVDGAVNIPLSELRARLDELPAERDIWVYCAVGQRAYYATRALLQRGRRVRNLSGGFQSWRAFDRTSG